MAEVKEVTKEEVIEGYFREDKKTLKKIFKEAQKACEREKRFQKAYECVIFARDTFAELVLTAYADHLDNLCKRIDEHINSVKQEIQNK